MKKKILEFIEDEMNPKNMCKSCGLEMRDGDLVQDEDCVTHHYCPRCEQEVQLIGVHPERVKLLFKLLKHLGLEKEYSKMK